MIRNKKLKDVMAVKLLRLGGLVMASEITAKNRGTQPLVEDEVPISNRQLHAPVPVNWHTIYE